MRLAGMILATVGMLPFLTTGATAAPPESGDVERLIERLDAGTLRERAAAEQELLGVGPELLPLLPAPELLPSPSAREAVRRIRLRLEHDRAVASVAASQVDVPDSATVEELLEVIARQTGNRIDPSRLPEEKLARRADLKGGRAAFWPLMDRLSDAMDFRFEPDAESGTLRLVPLREEPDARPTAVAHSGAFRIAVESAELRPRFGRENETLLRLRLGILAEPRLRPLFLKFAADDVRVTDETGEAIAPFNPQAQWELPLGEGGKGIRLQLDFVVPRGRVPKQIAVAGSARMLTAAGSETFTFDRLAAAAGTARRRGGVTVKLDRVKFEKGGDEAGRAEIGLIVSYDTGGPAFESHRTWIFHNQASLVTDQGMRVEREGNFGTRLQRDGGVAVDYEFTNLTHPFESYQFLYVAPTLLVNAPVDLSISQVSVFRSKDR